MMIKLANDPSIISTDLAVHMKNVEIDIGDLVCPMCGLIWFRSFSVAADRFCYSQDHYDYLAKVAQTVRESTSELLFDMLMFGSFAGF